MRRLCQHNFGHNRYVWESGIMLAFLGDYKALTVGKSADCIIPLKKDRDTLIEQSETLIEQSPNIIYSNKAVTLI